MLGLSRQYGLSLISLLVGLFISMLCILAGLTLYKSTLTLSTESKIGAQHDGQIAGAMLTLQRELQNAGYGVTGAVTSNVVLTSYNTTVTTSDGGTRTIANPVLAWRYSGDLGTTFTCRAVMEYRSPGSGISYQTLALATANACDKNTELANVQWDLASSVTKSVIGRWPIFGKLGERLEVNDSLFTFSEPFTATCSPYGAFTTGDQHLQVTISAPSSAILNLADNAVNHEFTLCLLNTYP